ncbi:hypothetical protein [Acuticoccus sp.]|uniref:hypothetical protein n=1 Tax=Acuticoccus sp. TaxID=1904378 RepID=UPI003B515F75
MKFLGCLVAALAGIVVCPAYAQQELEPLQRYLQRPPEQLNASYAFERCAGLHLGVLDYGGAFLPLQLQQNSQQLVVLLTRVATTLRVHGAAADLDAMTKYVVDDVDRIAKLYHSRMKNNYAASGEAWGSDPTIQSDLIACNVVIEVAGKAYPSFKE